MAAGHNGVSGPSVANVVKEEFRRDLGLAAIPHRQMVEEIVREMRQSHRTVTNIAAQLMEVTLHGVNGVSAASHVKEDIRIALAHVPIPRQLMEDEHAMNSGGDWDKITKEGFATQMLNVKVYSLIITGF